MTATGFTFSEKEIKVKLTQESSPVNVSSPNDSSKSVAAKPKISAITCIKGKTTKKITGVNSKCPKGFKKK
jgi:hypothetical protein